MQSPFTGGKTILQQEERAVQFRKEIFPVFHFFYRCIDSGEEFSTDEIDQLNVNQVYNMYREKHGIPFPDEIKAIREQYDISAAKMSEILGLGINSYRQYEGGEMPAVANGRLIMAAKDPAEFKKFLGASRSVLTEREFEKYAKKVDGLIEAGRSDSWNKLLMGKILGDQRPSAFTGYRLPLLSRVSQIISYFSENVDTLWKTKLNKLLFYADFFHYKRTGYSITGASYRAIPHGPVPSEFDKLYIKLVDDGLIEMLEIEVRDIHGEAIIASEPFNRELFDASELESLSKTADEFGNRTATQLVRISHEEKAWLENEAKREMINYQKYAFGLKAI